MASFSRGGGWALQNFSKHLSVKVFKLLEIIWVQAIPNFRISKNFRQFSRKELSEESEPINSQTLVILAKSPEGILEM